jgi:hypothetical protein
VTQRRSCLIPAAVSTNSMRVRRKSLSSTLLNARSKRVISADAGLIGAWAGPSESFTTLRDGAALILSTLALLFSAPIDDEIGSSGQN